MRPPSGATYRRVGTATCSLLVQKELLHPGSVTLLGCNVITA